MKLDVAQTKYICGRSKFQHVHHTSMMVIVMMLIIRRRRGEEKGGGGVRGDGNDIDEVDDSELDMAQTK